MRIFALAVTLLTSLVASADDNCTKPPAGAIIVDRSGSNGGYRTIGEAVEKLDGQADKQVLFIYPGTYSERVVIKQLKGTLVLQGYTCDKMSYRKNEVTITYEMSQLNLPPHDGVDSNDLASTLSINTDQVQVYNLNLVNTAIQTREKGQAPALSVICKTCAFYACSITGHQDTLYANRGNQLYARSHVAGTVDFIFGNARAFFQLCDIESVGPGSITANGLFDDTYFVFNKAKVFGSSPTKVYLGRSWGEYARVVFQSSTLGDIINPEGWTLMDPKMDTSHVSYKEYKNTGPGSAINKRVAYSGQLDSPVSISTILGDDFANFVDQNYMKDIS